MFKKLVLHMKSSSKNERFITGSKTLDLIIFVILLFLILVTSYHLRVFYQVTVAEVNVIRISPDGSRINVPTKNLIRIFSLADLPPSVMWKRLRYVIEIYMKKNWKLNQVQPGTQFDWVIRYSYNSTDLDNERIISIKVDGDKQLRK